MVSTYSQSDKVIPCNIHGNRVPLFLVHGVKGQAYISPHFLSNLGDEQPVYAFQASGLKHPKERYWTVEEMAQQYIATMREIQPEGPYVIGAIAVGSVVAIEMAQQLMAADAEVAPLLLIDPPTVPPGERGWLRRKRRGIVDRVRRRFFEEKVNRKTEQDLKRITEAERIALDINDQEELMIACRTAYDFRLALNDYTLRAYNGNVCLLGRVDKLLHRSTGLKKRPGGGMRVASNCLEADLASGFVGAWIIDTYQLTIHRLASHKISSHRSANQFVHTA